MMPPDRGPPSEWIEISLLVALVVIAAGAAISMLGVQLREVFAPALQAFNQ